MDTRDLGEGWGLQDDGIDVLLTGPGNLEIDLHAFDVRRLVHEEGLGPDILGSLRQLSWRYPLAEGDSPDTDLQLIVTWDTAARESPGRYMLHVGNRVAWELPETVGPALGSWLAQQEEHRRTRA